MLTSYLAPFTGYRGVLANFSLSTRVYLSLKHLFIPIVTYLISYLLFVSLQLSVTYRLSKVSCMHKSVLFLSVVYL